MTAMATTRGPAAMGAEKGTAMDSDVAATGHLVAATAKAIRMAVAAITERMARMAVEAGAEVAHEGTHRAATLGTERGADRQGVAPRPLPEERATGGCPPEGGRSKG